MIASDRPQFARLLAGVMAIYQRDVSEFALDVWWSACQRYDMDQVRTAFNAHATDPDVGQYPPKPADLVKQLQGTFGDRALVAWGKTFEAMQVIGSYDSVVFDDGVIHAVVEDLGGWPALCKVSNDELPFVQRRFCDAYRAYSRRPDTKYPPRLAGTIECENGEKYKHHNPKPILIGDKHKAKEVLRLGVTSSRATFTELVETATKRLTGGAA